MRDLWSGFETTLRAGLTALEEAVQGATALLDQAGAHTEGRLDGQEVDGQGRVHGFQHLTATQRNQQMVEGTREAIERVQERLQGDLLPALGDALRSLHEEHLPALAGSLEEAAEAVGVGLGVVGSMAAFAPPLVWAHGVVGTIGDLLEAMNLGL